MKKIRTEEHIDFCKIVGANLRKMRIERKLTQAQVGRSIQVRFQQIQKYEMGSNCLSAWRLKQLANLFKVSMMDILDPQYIAKFCQKQKSQRLNGYHV